MADNQSKSKNIAERPFLQPQNLLYLDIPRSNLAEYLGEAHRLVTRCPEILRKIDADLDFRAREKKRIRILDKIWALSQNRNLLNLGDTTGEMQASDLRLQCGRPRMSAYVVYMLLMLRGYWCGVKCSEFSLLLRESKTIHLFLTSYNACKMPGSSTISENINAVSNPTLQFIFDAQIKLVIDDELDDFKEITIDSTSVSANSAWPTDSSILTNLVIRIFHRGKKLHKFEIPDIADRRFPNIIKKMRELSKAINFTVKKPGSKAKRKKLYRKLLKEARSAHKAFESELQKVKSAHSSLDIVTSRYLKLERLIVLMVDDVQALINVIGYCSKRINDGQNTPSKDKSLSLSDKSAGFIKKGDREPVIGYKPQIGRSKNGFIPAFQVPLGNAADSGEFLNIVTDGMERTGIIPKTISVDDGYASTDARSELLEMKIEVVSISGSKGKKIVGEEVWESKEYVEARNDRSAVESLMFTIKHNFNFGRVMRRGLENVRAELLEKVLAYNFCRITEVRNRKKPPQDFDLAA